MKKTLTLILTILLPFITLSQNCPDINPNNPNNSSTNTTYYYVYHNFIIVDSIECKYAGNSTNINCGLQTPISLPNKGFNRNKIDSLMLVHGNEIYLSPNSQLNDNSCIYNNTGTANTSLPVTWSRFEVINMDRMNILNWSTESEYINDYFVIEKTIDGQNWDSIGLVFGNGTTSMRSEYTYIDSTINLSDIVYYRLKQVDTDGRYDYSEILSLKLNIRSNYINVYPNPSNDYFYLLLEYLDIDYKTNIIICSLSGDILFNSEIILSTGVSIERIDISMLKSGIYILYLQLPNELIFIKLKKI
jgi:hypothetical protein